MTNTSKDKDNNTSTTTVTVTPTTPKGKPPTLKKPGLVVTLLGVIAFYVLELLNAIRRLFIFFFTRRAAVTTKSLGGRVSSFPEETLDSTSAAFVVQKPSHISFVITGAYPTAVSTKQDTDDSAAFFASAARLVWYAVACDVKYISLYDPSGLLKSNNKAFTEVLNEVKKSMTLLNGHFNSKDRCHISLTVVTQDAQEEHTLGFSFASQKGVLDDAPISQDPETVFNVRLYDLSDGRGDIVALTKETAKDSSLSPSDVTQDYISQRLKGKTKQNLNNYVT